MIQYVSSYFCEQIHSRSWFLFIRYSEKSEVSWMQNQDLDSCLRYSRENTCLFGEWSRKWYQQSKFCLEALNHLETCLLSHPREIIRIEIKYCSVKSIPSFKKFSPFSHTKLRPRNVIHHAKVSKNTILASFLSRGIRLLFPRPLYLLDLTWQALAGQKQIYISGR